MKKLFSLPVVFFLLGLIIDFSAYSQPSSEIPVIEGVRFDLQPNQQGVLRIRPKSNKNFEDNKDITFTFTNAECNQSVDYSVQLTWGPETSEEIKIPCGRKTTYFTGYNSGDIKLIIRFANHHDARKVKGAVVTVTQAVVTTDFQRIPWK